MNYIEQISMSSPWWSNPFWDKNDRNIVSALNSSITFRHLPDHIPEAKPGLDIIRGPRQIGKTTELKMMIRDLLGKGAPPKSLVYFTCDILAKYRDLFELLKNFSSHLSLNNIKNGMLFLDEISSLKDWQKGIKAAIDLGLTNNIRLIVTGSSSIELKSGYERMPGRRDGGKDFLFLPHSFGNFCSLINRKAKNVVVRLMETTQSEKAFNIFRNEVSADTAYYKTRLSAYLKTGGFPKSISDFVKFGEIGTETLSINQSILFSEFEKHKKNLSTLMQIMRLLLNNISTPISYTSLMKNLELGSAKTVKEYLETLERSYLGIQVPCLDIAKKKPFNKKNKKIYFSDPMVIKTVEDKLKIPPFDESKMAENLVAVHISRTFLLNEWSQMGYLDKLFYWKSARGNEVDFVFFPDNKIFGIEVKYQETVSGWDEVGINKGIGQGLLITKDTFEYGKIPKIPLWAFLLME